MGSRGPGAPGAAALPFPIAAVFALAAAWIAFSLQTATSAWSFPHFLLALIAFVYLPGKALLARTRLSLEPEEDLTLSLVLGMLASSALFWLLGYFHCGYAFRLLPL